jgi:hypothetical protein
LVVVCCGANYALQSYGLHVFQPGTGAETLNPEQARWYSSIAFRSFTHGLQLAGHLTQLEFNRRSKTFAGDYALTAYLHIPSILVGSLAYVDRFIGVHDTRNGLSFFDVVSFATYGYAAWQAYTLPRVEQDVKDVEEE